MHGKAKSNLDALGLAHLVILKGGFAKLMSYWAIN